MFSKAHLVNAVDRQRPVACVTGGAANIGHAVAARLHADGYQMVITTYDGGSKMTERGSPVFTSIEAARNLGERQCWDVVACDLAQVTDCRAVVDFLQARFGRLDCLVNNAATWTYGHLDDVDDLDWREVMEVNVLAPIRLVRLARGLLAASSAPRVVNLGSSAGFLPEAGIGPYCVSKAALHCATRWLAVELAEESILVNAVAPGFIETSTNVLYSDVAEALASRLRTIPLGRAGTTEEVAHVVSVLASPMLGFVTGEIVRCDGGFLSGASRHLLES